MPSVSLAFRRFLVVVSAALAMGFSPKNPHERAVEVLSTLADDRLATDGVATRTARLRVGARHVRVRTYVPLRPLGRTIVIAHGVHHAGIDEPRLVRFADRCAAVGYHVVTPELEDLAAYRVTETSIDVIDAVVRDAATGGVVPGGQVGLIGISFGGGLSLVAASRPDVAPHLAYVASLGGHHDLSRVLRFFLTNVIDTPAGPRPWDAHEYGLTILVLSAAESLVPREDAKALRIVLGHWLTEDRELARRQAGALATPEGRRIFELLEGGGLATLKPKLERFLDGHAAELARVSPAGHLGSLGMPAYLVHGATDRVIPPSEAAWADRELGARPHQVLVTSLIEHVMPDHPAPFVEKLRLIDLVARLLPEGAAPEQVARRFSE